MNDQDERLRRSLIEAKMQNEQILEQNMEIEENLAKVYTWLPPLIYMRA